MLQEPGDIMNEQEQRIIEILGADNLAVSLKSLTLYRDYLRKRLDMPCVMTGMEHFPWEKEYVSPSADKAEYEALKKEEPSYTDTYELKRFEDLIDKVLGILAKVRRVSDNKRFILDLALLKAADEKSRNYTLLDDYSAWFADH
jgi:hypothetical protein